MGEFIVCEQGTFVAENSFMLTQEEVLYTTEIYFDAVKTIIDVDYENSIWGADYTFDLNTITWDIHYGAFILDLDLKL